MQAGLAREAAAREAAAKAARQAIAARRDVLRERTRVIIERVNASGHDWHKALGVASKPKPTEADVEKAYRDIRRLVHPDKSTQLGLEGGGEAFRRATTAYQVLR